MFGDVALTTPRVLEGMLGDDGIEVHPLKNLPIEFISLYMHSKMNSNFMHLKMNVAKNERKCNNFGEKEPHNHDAQIFTSHLTSPSNQSCVK